MTYTTKTRVTFDFTFVDKGKWLPPYELERGIGKYIDRLNRKSALTKEQIISQTE